MKILSRGKLVVIVTVAILLLAVSVVQANVRTGGAGETPFYARIDYEDVVQTDEWAAIVFYRPPECVPPDFNLLDFFDFSAFSCGPPTTDGFTVWEEEPLVGTPIMSKLHGLGAVPVWFVSWPELQAALADGILTVPELQAIQSLTVGSASFYTETLHPLEGAQVSMKDLVAQGQLEDGRSFQVHAVATERGTFQVRIVFR